MLDGTADEAIRFYSETFDAKVLFKQTYGQGPDPVPEAAQARISHSILSVGDSQLFIYDAFPGEKVQSGNGLQICITTPDADKTRQIYDALQQNGKVILPLQTRSTALSPISSGLFSSSSPRDKFVWKMEK